MSVLFCVIALMCFDVYDCVNVGLVELRLDMYRCIDVLVLHCWFVKTFDG